MHHNKFKLNSVFAAIIGLSAISPVLAEDAPKGAEQSMEKITVLGEKTERSLKDTTSSVSVITEEALNNGQFLTISDAISDVANLVVLSGSVPDIRGVSGNGSATGFNSFTGGAKARVSTLIDGIAEPFVADLTGDSGLWDIEQVEVYRGPQSTSNGRNSIGGSVFIKTKDPTFDWEGAARIGMRDQDQFVDTALMVSGPLIDDELAMRISAQRLDGDSINKGITYDENPITFDQNEIKNERLKTKLLWRPAAIENLSTMFTYSYNRERGDTGRNYFTGDDPWKFKPVTQRYMDTESDTASLKFDYQLNPDLSFDLLVAMMDYQWGFDAYEANEAAQSQVKMDENNTTFDAKMNFGLQNDALKGFVGLAYFERSQDFNSRGRTVYDGEDESSSKAIYGEVSYSLTDNLRVIAGGRVERESQVRDFLMSYRGSDIDSKLDKSKTISLPKLVLQYDLTDDTVISASARRGYNAGGGAVSFVTNEYYHFDSESVNTYELSARSVLVDGLVNFSANAFFNNYSDYQALDQFRVIVNIDEAQTYGLELEVSALVTDDLELKAGLGLLETEIKDAGESFNSAIGNELNSAPSMTANLGLKYWILDGLNIGISTNFVDEYYGDFTNTPERIAGDYILTRFTASYQTENWHINAFVNNAQDKQEVTSVSPADRRYPEGYASIVQPKTIGLSATYSF
ncbi:TonB-dependent receptor [Pseudoalteromonas denitrificans]|uniref:Outer membrane receptor proteins, mostly Fe transport n=1 Tax=Pseudoalteromonas denitrificans DSM 6059 TaxID=1123010 RepID=A0A1I1S4S8_9GAMM|nr:TonB-dependent receptor [Pseudoalteromonas denitrificans]SFD41499.1 Outer membrane receptor proteins, mostly Fe transport [Pseudoalteromonas denitrificans DSM 6059]